MSLSFPVNLLGPLCAAGMCVGMLHTARGLKKDMSGIAAAQTRTSKLTGATSIRLLRSTAYMRTARISVLIIFTKLAYWGVNRMADIFLMTVPNVAFCWLCASSLIWHLILRNVLAVIIDSTVANHHLGQWWTWSLAVRYASPSLNLSMTN